MSGYNLTAYKVSASLDHCFSAWANMRHPPSSKFRISYIVWIDVAHALRPIVLNDFPGDGRFP